MDTTPPITDGQSDRRMKTSLDHLPEHKQQQLRDAADIIVKAVKPDMLILLPGGWV